MRSNRCLLRLLLFAASMLPMAGYAENLSGASENSAMPRCGPQTDGQIYCKFGTVYECNLIGPDSLERRTGWRWQPDILRDCTPPSPASPEHRIYLSPPETGCRSRQSRHFDVNGTDAYGERSPRGQSGTIYIRPDDDSQPCP